MSETYTVEKWSGPGDPTREGLIAKLKGEGYNIFEWSDRPGTVYAMHEHGEDQSHCIINGQIELTIEGTGTFILGPGDRDFMPAGTRHSARIIGDEVVFYLIGSKSKW